MPIEIPEPYAITVPDAAVIGIVGLKGAGKGKLLGTIAERNPQTRLVSLGDPLNFSPVPVLALDGALACQDPIVKSRAAISIERARRQGTTVFLVSHDEPLLLRVADEIWWMNDGVIAAKGDPREVLAKYRGFIAVKMSEWGRSLSEPLNLDSRRGTGSAEIVSLETLDFAGVPAGVLRSGEDATVRVKVRFPEAVEEPVIGVMIRTRIGFEVYGTNTQLEGLTIFPRAAGSSIQVDFRFRCDLCPGDYTVTAACHDPDGTAHDWLDDAVAFSVADSRYTAGVANLRAHVSVTSPDE
jgi:lipopolysaccharide transport system ATP-binding protein